MSAGQVRSVLRRHYDGVADSFKAEGWMAGRTTMQEIAKGAARLVATTSSFPRETHKADRRDRNLAVAIDPHGKVHYGKDNALGDHVVAVLGENVSTPISLCCVKMELPISSPDRTGATCPKRCKRCMRPSEKNPCSSKAGRRQMGPFQGIIDEIRVVDGLARVPTIFEYAGAADERLGEG
jgi:hypothetical protein